MSDRPFTSAYDMSDPVIAETVRFVLHDVESLRADGNCIIFVTITPKPIVLLGHGRYSDAAAATIRAHFAFPDQLKVIEAP